MFSKCIELIQIAFIIFICRNVISAWSSGTGAAGVAGALTYAGLIYIGFSPKSTLLLMLIVPLMQLITFCFLLQEPNGVWTTLSNASSITSIVEHTNTEQDTLIVQPLTITEKLQYFPKMLKYVLPLFAVYLCEYLINQGLVSVLIIQAF